MLEHAFPELTAFYFPDAHARIDWTCAHVFLNTELRRIVRDADRLEASEADANPFALITAAHLYTVRTRHDPQARYGFKRRLARLLYWPACSPSVSARRRPAKRRASHAGTPVGMGYPTPAFLSEPASRREGDATGRRRSACCCALFTA